MMPVEVLFGALDKAGIEARFVGGCVRDRICERRERATPRSIARSNKPPETVMKALAGGRHQGRADRAEARHGDGDRQEAAPSSSRPCAATSRPTAATPSSPSPTTGARMRAAATSPSTRSTPTAPARSTTTSTARPTCRLAACALIGDPEQRIAEDRLRVLRFFRFHARYGRPPFDGPGFDACRRNAATVRGLSGERVAKELFRTLDAPGAADAFDAMLEAGVLDHWLPSMPAARSCARSRRARRSPMCCADRLGRRRSCRQMPTPRRSASA